MYSKQQIKEAGDTLVEILKAEKFNEAYVDVVYCTVDDILQILDGKLTLAIKPVARDFVLDPSNGFIPVLGVVVDDGRIDWYAEEDHAQNDS